MERRTKQKIIIALIAALGILLILYALINYTHEYGFKKLTDKAAGFSISFPKSWAYAQNKDGVNVIFYTPIESDLDNFTENVNVVAQDISALPMNLKEYAELAIKQMNIVFEGQINILESTRATLGAHPGYKFIFESRDEKTIKMLMLWSVKGNTAYQFTYTAQHDTFDHYLKDIERMAGSFRIIR